MLLTKETRGPLLAGPWVAGATVEGRPTKEFVLTFLLYAFLCSCPPINPQVAGNLHPEA